MVDSCKQARYLAGFFTRLFFGFGMKGVGGAESNRRSTSSALGCAGSCFFCGVLIGAL
jgi:hypothetical protein